MKGKLLSCFVGLPVRRRKGRESLCLPEDQAQQAYTPSERVGTQPSHSTPSSSVTSWGSPHVGLSGARFMRRWHSQCPGGHKLDKPQTGLVVTKTVAPASACETTYACRRWVQSEGDLEVLSSETISIHFPSLFDPGILPWTSLHTVVSGSLEAWRVGSREPGCSHGSFPTP